MEEFLSLFGAFFTPERIFFISVGSLALAISWIIGKALQNDILKKLHHDGVSHLAIPLIGKIIKGVFLAIGFLAFASALGINVSSIIQLIGLLGVGAGFIFKDLLADVVSGFYILTSKPFDAGHNISIYFEKGIVYQGKVVAIDIRYTTLENEKEKILIPNSVLFRQPINIMK